jgi:hypothetical protein
MFEISVQVKHFKENSNHYDLMHLTNNVKTGPLKALSYHIFVSFLLL